MSLFQDLGHGGVKEQVALRHVLAEVALHHADVDEVFEEGGGSGAGSGIGFGKLDEGGLTAQTGSPRRRWVS